MKKDTILFGLAIGLAVFLMRWFRAFAPIEDYQIHFLPLFGIYWALRHHFKKATYPNSTTAFIRSVAEGLKISIIASLFTGLLCMLFVNYPQDALRMYPKESLALLPFTSTLSYGVLISIICAAIYVYCRALFPKHDSHIKINTGQFIY